MQGLAWNRYRLWVTVLIAIGAFVVMATIATVHILTASANVVFADTWSLIPLVGRMLVGHVGPTALWAGVRHNENREVLETFILYGSARLDHLNVQLVKVLGVVFVSVTLSILVFAYCRWTRYKYSRVLLIFIPVAVLLFSLNQWENWLEEFNVVHFLSVTSAVLAFVAVERSRPWLALVLFLVILASLSSAEGLVAWPVVIFQLAFRRQWGAAAVVAVTSLAFVSWYLAGLGQAGAPGFLLHHIVYSGHFGLVVLGNTVWGYFNNAPSIEMDTLGGGVLLAVCVWILIDFVRKVDRTSAERLAVALTVFGLGVAALIVEGRAPAGLVAGAASRYSTITMGAALGPYLYCAFREGADWARRVSFVCVLGMVALGCCIGSWEEMRLGVARFEYFHHLQDILLSGRYSLRTLAPFDSPPNVTLAGIRTLQRLHLNIWAGR